MSGLPSTTLSTNNNTDSNTSTTADTLPTNNKRTFTQYNLQPQFNVTYTFNIPSNVSTTAPLSPIASDNRNLHVLKNNICLDIDNAGRKLKRHIRHITSDANADTIRAVGIQVDQYMQHMQFQFNQYVKQLNDNKSIDEHMDKTNITPTSTDSPLQSKRGPQRGSKRGFACLPCFISKSQCTTDIRPCPRCEKKQVECIERYKKEDGTNFERKELVKLYYNNGYKKINSTSDSSTNNSSVDHATNIIQQYTLQQPLHTQHNTLIPQQQQSLHQSLQPQLPLLDHAARVQSKQ